jgi:hypothetical protein
MDICEPPVHKTENLLGLLVDIRVLFNICKVKHPALTN